MKIELRGILFGIKESDIQKLNHSEIRIERNLLTNIELKDKYESIKINNNLLFDFDTEKGKNVCYEIIYEKSYKETLSKENTNDEIYNMYMYCHKLIYFVNIYLGRSIVFNDSNIYINGILESRFRNSIGGFVMKNSIEKFINVKIEEKSIKNFLDDFENIFNAIIDNKILVSIIDIYNSNLYTNNERIIFINLVSCLEMLLISGNNELRYKISRGVAVLLSEDKESGRELFDKMKILYDIRSKLVHEGEYDYEKFLNRFKVYPLEELKNIVNKSVRKFIEMNMDRSITKKDLIKLINESGYGSLNLAKA